MTENTTQTDDEIPTIQRIIAVIWPSFLVAGVETVVFFTLFDPVFVFYEYDVSRVGAYSIGFFLFWAFATLPCILTMYFARPCRPCAGHREDVKNSEN